MLTSSVRTALLAAAAAATVLVPAPAAFASPAPPRAVAPVDVVGLDFQLINGLSRQCLASPGDGRVLVQKRCADAAPYRWRLAPQSVTGLFHVINAGTGRCLTADGPGRTSLGPCDSRPARVWRMRDSADPYAQVQNMASRRCLTVDRNDVAVQGACDNERPRRWTVRLLSVPFFGVA